MCLSTVLRIFGLRNVKQKIDIRMFANHCHKLQVEDGRFLALIKQLVFKRNENYFYIICINLKKANSVKIHQLYPLFITGVVSESGI